VLTWVLSHVNYEFEYQSSAVGVMIVFRSWRYVRISHGIMEVTAEMADHKFERLLNHTEHLEDILREHGTPIPRDQKVEKFQQDECELIAQARRHHAEEKIKNKKDMHHADSGGGDLAETTASQCQSSQDSSS